MSDKKRRQEESTSGEKTNGKSPLIKLLSCQRCRSRKVKCNFEYPCSNCLKVGAACVQVTNDKRKRRPPANYVSSLEKKVQKFAEFFEKFKSLNSIDEKQQLLERTDLIDDHYPHIRNEVFNALSEDHLGDRAVYGPTSVYDDSLIPHSSKIWRNDEAAINLLNKDPDILESLQLFFKWQYPDHNMFLFRESFLTDFFSPKSDSLYCSRVLVLSVCALGSRMSSKEKVYEKSLQYYSEAKNSLLGQLNQPSITSLQGFLLLAFYDICQGFNSSAWMLSGNAMRMGFDLGFQLNPKVWFFKSKDNLTQLDIAIRSRIYWGCYVADHFLSLLLGRPSSLKMSDATIPETKNLPDLEWIKEYTYSRTEDTIDTANISNPLRKIINLINISDNILNDIFTKSEFESKPSNNEDLNLVSRLKKLDEYNTQIMSWKRSLPDDLQWDRESLKKTAHIPTLGCIRYYYYILILCLNRPFIGITKRAADDDELIPSVICSNAIEDLYGAIDRFQSIHGLRRASIFIVYCSILSISIILLNSSSDELLKERNKLQFFMDILKGCSKTWKLAEKSYKIIDIKLKSKLATAQEKHNISSTETLLPSQEGNETINHDPTSKQNGMPSLHQSEILFKENGVASMLNEKSSLKNVEHIYNFEETALKPKNNRSSPKPDNYFKSLNEQNTDLLFDENLEFFGGPPVLMTSDLFNQDWESLFPDSVFKT
ncbi:uncharacterized protein PRCAT00002380001 [Priceomyces carsonii]|uniref:uncharacterized protein n=1 Tax=Priceomyces carsonii TaxID=28549 RepID=UPI002ED89D01|nr:unnamed protein product [Priceomyces carsonii]